MAFTQVKTSIEILETNKEPAMRDSIGLFNTVSVNKFMFMKPSLILKIWRVLTPPLYEGFLTAEKRIYE